NESTEPASNAIGSTLAGRMLADDLEKLAPELMAWARARGVAPPPGRPPILMQSLVQTLREGTVDVAAWRRHADIGLDVKAAVQKLRVFRECIYHGIEAHALPVTPREMALLSEFFVTINAIVYGEESRRFNALLDALPDFVALDDADGRIVHLNRTAADDLAKLTGLAADALIGRRIFELGLPAPVIRR